MPTQSALDIVNALFAGQKDLSDYVATAMNSVALDALEDKKKEVGAQMFAPPESEEETPEEEEQPTNETEDEDETDQGGD